MRGMRSHAVCAVLMMHLSASAADHAATFPVACWHFDESAGAGVLDSRGNVQDVVTGRSSRVAGCSGHAIKFDGFTGHIRREAARVPRLTGDFSVESWVALGAYPWNLCPIADHRVGEEKGWFFGIDADGRIGLSLVTGGERSAVWSASGLPLREWVHVAGIYSPESGIRVYINGREVGHAEAKGLLVLADGADLLIGRHRETQMPTGSVRPQATLPVHTFLDGILDELAIYDGSLTTAEIKARFERNRPADKPALPPRVLPSGPPGPGPFGAYYVRLKYYPEWDAFWRVGDQADVIVRFDQAGYRFVFWRGTSYIPCWVTQEGMWYTNEFNETWGHGAIGCAEPMSDKQCRHSHVRILESHDARVVIHWRYALVDTRYQFARVDSESGWGDWSDELYTIYPDGVGVRKITLWSSQPMQPHEFQDSIMVHSPGRRPEDDVETEAVTMVNMKGETCTYSWADGCPQAIDKPDQANIEVIHFKSRHDPFLIVSDEPCAVSAKGPRFRPYRGSLRREVSMFPWWNHWPVAQIPCDGRNANFADRASHSCVTNQLEWKDHEVTANSRTRIMLHGMSDQPANQLAVLARSWLKSPRLTVSTSGCRSMGYDEAERAYVLRCEQLGHPVMISGVVEASHDAPVMNPAFIIEGWGPDAVQLSINDTPVRQGDLFRYGYRKGLDRTDLIVWLKMESDQPLNILWRPAVADPASARR